MEIKNLLSRIDEKFKPRPLERATKPTNHPGSKKPKKKKKIRAAAKRARSSRKRNR